MQIHPNQLLIFKHIGGHAKPRLYKQRFQLRGRGPVRMDVGHHKHLFRTGP